LLALVVLAGACAPRVAEERPGPSLGMKTHTWDFGTLERGKTKTESIPLTNQGLDTLRVTLYSTCDCLTAIPLEAALPPGGTATVTITYMGDEIKAPVSKTVFIDSNDPVTPRLAFKVTGNVIPGKAPHLVAAPDPLPIDPSNPSYPTTHLTVKNLGEESLDIAGITCFGCATAWGRMQLAQGDEVVIDITPLPDWADKRWLEIESNDPVQPLKRIAIVELK
jgi:hypothetical protein